MLLFLNGWMHVGMFGLTDAGKEGIIESAARFDLKSISRNLSKFPLDCLKCRPFSKRKFMICYLLMMIDVQFFASGGY
jgi:hypothetical protein